ncbi:EAL domain-containing protein (plasmid) [Leptospira sp. WS60.C2]
MTTSLLEHPVILEEISEGVVITDKFFNIHYANKYAQFVLGIPENYKNKIYLYQNLSRSTYEFLKSLKFEDSNQKIQRLGILEFRSEKKITLLDVSINTIEKDRNILFFKNVTDILGLMDSIVTQENQFTHLFHAIPDMLLLINGSKTILMANKSVYNILGWIPSKTIGNSFENFIHSEDKKLFQDLYQESLLNNKIQVGLIRVQNRAGGYSIIEFYVYSDRSDDSDRVYYLGRDVTEKNQYENLLLEKISKDDLTKLSSKKYLYDSIENLIQELNFGRISAFYIFYIDIDRFKDINDSLGYSAGDSVIKLIASRLTRISAIYSKTFIARIGGDKFAIVISCESFSIDPIEICELIQSYFSEILNIQGHQLLLTCSIGVSTGDRSYKDSEKILRHADIALHEAKKKGRGKYCIFEARMQERKYNSFQMESWLREAIDNSNFTLQLQPIVSMQDNIISHAEALCRWNHYTHGNIPPIEFIQLAEETGQIHNIGNWILINACKLLEGWNRNNRTIVPIAINLSPLQFENPNLPKLFSIYLEKHKLRPENIHIELTESLIMSNTQHSIKVLTELKEMGLTIYLDDFGTGYSSLNYLIHFPIDIIKIDKSFIDNILLSNNGFSVVKAIIKMAESLSIKVVAEGVEKREQYEMLKEIGCNYAQGYFISKPLPSDDFNLIKLNEELVNKGLIYTG